MFAIQMIWWFQRIFKSKNALYKFILLTNFHVRLIQHPAFPPPLVFIPEHKLVMVGLDNAGKTTILYQFLMNEVVHTSPTIGSNVEEIVWKNIHFLVWDLAGESTYQLVHMVHVHKERATLSILKLRWIQLLYWNWGFLLISAEFHLELWLLAFVRARILCENDNINRLLSFLLVVTLMLSFGFFFVLLRIELGQQSLRTAWSTYYTNTEVSIWFIHTFGSMFMIHELKSKHYSRNHTKFYITVHHYGDRFNW